MKNGVGLSVGLTFGEVDDTQSSERLNVSRPSFTPVLAP